MARVLLKHRADSHIRNNQGQSPMDIFKENAEIDMDVIELLSSYRSSSSPASHVMVFDRRHTLWEVSKFLSKKARLNINDELFRFWVPFVCLRHIYLDEKEDDQIHIDRMKIDPNRWTEVPKDYENVLTIGDIERRTLNGDLRGSINLGIERCSHHGQFQHSSEITLEIGSIVDIVSTSWGTSSLRPVWHESVICSVRFNESTEESAHMTATLSVHPIGQGLGDRTIKTIEVDSQLSPIDSSDIAPRGKHSKPYVIKDNKFELDGAINWKKVADFSALLPREVKLKLWNGVFRTESDLQAPEWKRIWKALRTMAMLQVTRVKPSMKFIPPSTERVQMLQKNGIQTPYENTMHLLMTMNRNTVSQTRVCRMISNPNLQAQ